MKRVRFQLGIEAQPPPTFKITVGYGHTLEIRQAA